MHFRRLHVSVQAFGRVLREATGRLACGFGSGYSLVCVTIGVESLGSDLHQVFVSDLFGQVASESKWVNKMDRLPVLRKSGEGRTIAVVGDVYRFLATGEETDGKYAMWEAVVSPGGGPPPHIHSREEESFYVLEGEITFTLDDQTIVARPGMFANMPVGSLHSFKNNTDKPARMILSVAPAGFERMLFELGRPFEDSSADLPLPSKEEIDRLLQLAPAYGLEIRLPGGR